MKHEIYEGLREVFKDLQLTERLGKIEGQTLLGIGGIMDSLTAVQLIAAVERRFKVNILEDLNLDALETTDTLVDFILARQGTALS